MASKYRSKKVKIDGMVFDSKKEANRYLELKLLVKAKEIRDLELQPRFVLQESFKRKGKTHRAITYIADFKYIDCKTGKTVVEDTKGYRTEVYNIKKKLFLNKYPDMEFVES